MNDCRFTGRAIKDADVKVVNEKRLAVFSLAVGGSEGKGGTFVRCVCWGSLAHKATELACAGAELRVRGRLQNRSWTDKTSGEKKYMTEVVLAELEPAAESTTVTSTAITASHPISDQDIPF